MVVHKRPSLVRRPSVLHEYDLSDSLRSILEDVPDKSEMLTSSSHHRASIHGSASGAGSAFFSDDLSVSSTHSHGAKSLFGGSQHSQTLTNNSFHKRGSGSNVQTAYGRRGLGLTKRQSVRDMTSAMEAKRVALPARKKEDNPNYLPNIVGDLKASIAGRDVFEDYDHRKKANSICRWNLLWLVLLFMAPYPLWLTFVNCRLAYELTIFLNIVITLNYVYTTVLCWRYMWRMIRAFNTPFWEELDEEVREKVQHIVVMPTYKEPIELLLETISSIANQTVADSIIMVVGMEQRTPDQESKKRQINEQFGESFKALVYSVHPSGVPGEIPGACSNRNYAARTAVKHMIREGMLPVDPHTKEVDLDFTMVTVCDADTTFYYRYFENLTSLFLREDPKSRFQVCWQSPLFYNIALDERWFFTRVMGILRSYFMIGFLIGCDINTMSIYSQSLRLLIESRYFHPGYQMDDIIYTLSAMKATGKRIRIRVIDIPTLSGPTSGDTIFSEFDEWVVQATRWTIGAAEVFHYFFVKLLRGNYFLPGFAYFWWFVYYYGFVLCVNGLVNMSNLVIFMASVRNPEIGVDQCQPFGMGDDFPYGWIFPFFIIFTQVMVFGTAFFMDALVSQVLALAEEINPLRNFLHWISSAFVLMVYCLVEYKAILTIAIYGKKVCGHKASEKGSLVKKENDPNKSSVTAGGLGGPGSPGGGGGGGEDNDKVGELPAIESWKNNNNNDDDDKDPAPFKTAKPKNHAVPFHMSILNEADESDSNSGSSAVSFASSSDTSSDSWHDEEAPAELASTTSKHSYAQSTTSGGGNIGNLLQSLDESCRRLENRFQQKLLDRQEEMNASMQLNTSVSMNKSAVIDNNNRRDQDSDDDEATPMLSTRADRAMSQPSGMMQREPSMPLSVIGLSKQPSSRASAGPGAMQREASMPLSAIGLVQSQEQPPPPATRASSRKQPSVNRKGNLKQPPPPPRQEEATRQSLSPVPRNSINSTATSSSVVNHTRRKPRPSISAMDGDVSFGSYKDTTSNHNINNIPVSITNDPLRPVESAGVQGSSWMHKGSTPESVTRRPLILQLLDWSQMQLDKEGAHGYATPYMTGVMSSLDEEAYVPPRKKSPPPKQKEATYGENGYRTYLRN